MKYSEFKAEVENMGFVVIDSGAPIYVDKDKDGETLISIDVHRRFRLDPGWSGFNKLTEDQQLRVYYLAYQLAKTPLAEREEEKQYRLWLSAYGASDFDLYRTKGHGLGGTNLNALKSVTDPLLIFTESEIAELDIDGFEKVEVTP